MRDLDHPIEFARHRRRSATSGEFLMWQIVRDRQRCNMKFRREHPLGPYTCDFYCVEAKLVIECDGKDHFTEEGMARDAIRDAWMARQGITVLRFSNQTLENETQAVMNIIDRKLLELTSPSPPAPLPEDGARGARSIKGDVHEESVTKVQEKEALYVLPPLFSDDEYKRARSIKTAVRQEDAMRVQEKDTLNSPPAPGLIKMLDIGDIGEVHESKRHSDSRSLLPGTPGRRAGDEGPTLQAYSAPHPPSPSPQKTGARGRKNQDGMDLAANAFSSGQSEGEAFNDRTFRPAATYPSNAVNTDAEIRAKPYPSGFTLIELLVTLVIVSVLAAATLPAFKNVIVERKTSVAALEVKAFLDAARARAIARGRPVSVILERLSSRGDGLGIDGTAVISPTNPPRSITAENPPAPLTLPWTPSDVATNFDVYNTCIRMVMAESMRPVEIEFVDPFNLAVNGFRATDEGTALDDLPNSGALSDALDEPHKLILIPGALDNRLPSLLVPGNDIDIESTGGAVYSSTILAVTPVSGNYLIKIRNEGLSTNPYGSPLDVAQLADDQLTMHSYVNMGIAKTLRIYSQPRPVASMVTELPRGSCIDLSLSGLASDDPNVNPTNNVFRDCRRQFASDWILPPLVLPPPVPIPQSLRPVYLNFSASGKLQSVLCNGPSSASLRRIEPQSDVCLFVGRNDQVIRAASTADLAAAEDASLKPNLMDPTSYWVRISPSSGAISAAPAQASHIIEDVADFRAGNPAEPIGHLLEDSRSLIFGAELTSQ